jgi:hypothetical protein
VHKIIPIILVVLSGCCSISKQSASSATNMSDLMTIWRYGKMRQSEACWIVPLYVGILNKGSEDVMLSTECMAFVKWQYEVELNGKKTKSSLFVEHEIVSKNTSWLTYRVVPRMPQLLIGGSLITRLRQIQDDTLGDVAANYTIEVKLPKKESLESWRKGCFQVLLCINKYDGRMNSLSFTNSISGDSIIDSIVESDNSR